MCCGDTTGAHLTRGTLATVAVESRRTDAERQLLAAGAVGRAAPERSAHRGYGVRLGLPLFGRWIRTAQTVTLGAIEALGFICAVTPSTIILKGEIAERDHRLPM
jgi:hypothetical protein